MKSIAITVLFCISLYVLAAGQGEEFEQLMIKHADAVSQHRNDRIEFIAGLRKLAMQNHRESQFILGMQVFAGAIEGKEAVKWFHRAADNGCAGAEGIIGQMYLAGKFVPKSETIGLLWVRKAAAHGEVSSMVIMASVYANGRYGTLKDPVQAYSWLYEATKIKSTKTAIAEIKVSIENLEKKLTPEQIREARKMTEARIERMGGIPKNPCSQAIPIR